MKFLPVVLEMSFKEYNDFLAHLSKAQGELLGQFNVRRVSCGVNNFTVTTLEATILIQSSSDLLRMFILTISRANSKVGGIRSKTRSPDLILEKPCYHSRGHNFDPIFTRLAQDVHLNNILDKYQSGWDWVKN